MKKLAIALLLALGLSRAYAAGVWDSQFWATNIWALNVWQSEEVVNVPSVIGQANAAAAQAIIEGEDLVLGSIVVRCSDVPADQVVLQSPIPGKLALVDSLVHVFVSNGIECPDTPRIKPRFSFF